MTSSNQFECVTYCSVNPSYRVTFLISEMRRRKSFKQPVNSHGNMGIILWLADL